MSTDDHQDPLWFDWEDLVGRLDDPSEAVETISTDSPTVVITEDGSLGCFIKFPPTLGHDFQIASMHMESHTCRAGEGFAHAILGMFALMVNEIAEPWQVWAEHHPQQVKQAKWERLDLTQPPPEEHMYRCG